MIQNLCITSCFVHEKDLFIFNPYTFIILYKIFSLFLKYIQLILPTKYSFQNPFSTIANVNTVLVLFES